LALSHISNPKYSAADSAFIFDHGNHIKSAAETPLIILMQGSRY
jgi:hypothetical protein